MANEAFTNDGITNEVINKLISRQQVGYEEYGTTLEDSEAGMLYWITHAQEEMLDGAQYLEKMKQKFEHFDTLELIANLAAAQELSGYTEQRADLMRELLVRAGKL